MFSIDLFLFTILPSYSLKYEIQSAYLLPMITILSKNIHKLCYLNGLHNALYLYILKTLKM